jgi:transcriptional regulator with XRE-family HTH domain
LFCQYNVRKTSRMNNRFLGVDGSKLRRLREERAMSLRDLGEASGVGFDTISRLELGKQDAQPRTVRALAEALGVEPAALMKEED